VRIRKAGKVIDNLWLLGHETSGVYLLEGKEGSIIISGGVSCIVPAILHQIEAFGIDMAQANKILILHSHFDHVGIVPFLKRLQPEIEIYASKRAWEILSMPKAIDTINAFNRSVTEQMGMAETCSEYDLEWRDDICGKEISDGDEIDLGDVKLQIIETPGHSSCAISAYEPVSKALFPTDSGGIPFKQMVVTSGNSNYTKFQKSLEKLRNLDVAVYCADHYGYVTGEEASAFIDRSIEVAKEHRRIMEEAYARTKDIDKATEELVASFYDENQDYFLPQDIFGAVYRQMVRHIAEVMEGEI
jgi:glyoxylase-like metal-dependent hydrolase (beta-lactamase superfamily II)